MSIVKIMKSTIDKTKSTTYLTKWDLNLKIQNIVMNLIKSLLVIFFWYCYPCPDETLILTNPN